MNKELERFGINEDLYLLSKETERELQDKFKELDNLCEYNSLKVLNSFQKHNVTEASFASTTGYGHGDIGRDTIEEIFADKTYIREMNISNSADSGCVDVKIYPNEQMDIREDVYKTIVDNNITMLQMYIDKKSLEDIFIEATTDVDEPIDYEEDFQDEEVQENITDDTEKEIEENPDDNEDKEDE